MAGPVLVWGAKVAVGALVGWGAPALARTFAGFGNRAAAQAEHHWRQEGVESCALWLPGTNKDGEGSTLAIGVRGDGSKMVQQFWTKTMHTELDDPAYRRAFKKLKKKLVRTGCLVGPPPETWED